MTELSEAWKSPTRSSIIVPKKEHPNVEAYNSQAKYDEFVINVDAFKPFRIDVTIKDRNLIDRMKTMTTADQTSLITTLLHDYFERIPIESFKTNEQIHVPYSTPNSTPNRFETEMEVLVPNSTPNDVKYLKHDPESIPQIEFMKSQHTKSCDDSILLLILVLALWMLLDRVMQIVQHA